MYICQLDERLQDFIKKSVVEFFETTWGNAPENFVNDAMNEKVCNLDVFPIDSERLAVVLHEIDTKNRSVEFFRNKINHFGVVKAIRELNRG